MAVSGVQGQLLEITVVECRKLKDTEWISRQDPYVCLEYGSTKFRTRTCTDGGKNPKFQEKFLFTLVEGLREINVVVWNSNTLSSDDFIGSGKIQLQEVLSRGYCDQFWSLQTKSGRYAGEVKLIMHHQKPNKPEAPSNPNAAYSSFAAPSQPHVSPYSAPPAASAPSNPNPAYSSPPTAYPPKPSAYPNTTYSSPAPAYPNPAYSTPATAYPPMGSPYPNPAYPSPPSAYPPPPDPCMHPPPVYPHPAPYPASPYPAPSAYPASPYPPTSAYPYPPPPNASPYAPPGPYGMYPPPPPPY